MASDHNLITTISNDTVDYGTDLIAAAGEGQLDVDMDMVRQIFEADREMKMSRSSIWYNLCKGIGRMVIRSFVKRILRHKPILLKCSSLTTLEDETSELGDSDNGAIGIEFLAAAEEGPVVLVRRIFKTYRDMIVVGDPMGNTALHMAAKAGHCGVVLELIRIARLHGKLERAIGDQNIDGDTPLHLAIKNRHLQAAQCLVDTSNLTMFYVMANKDGEYPWDLARQYGYIDLVLSMPWPQERFFSFTADLEMALSRQNVEAEDEKEDIVISWANLAKAIVLNQEKVVMRILAEEPSLILHSDTGRETTVFHAAALGGKVGMIRWLVHYITTNTSKPGHELAKLMSIRDNSGYNPLMLALASRNMSAALYLIELAPQAMFQLNNCGVSPLYFTVQKGHKDILSFMIDHSQVSDSIQENLHSHAMETCLAHAAIKSKHLGMLQILMKKLPYLINSTDAKGWKPLSYAASMGYIDQVSFFQTNFPNSISKYDKDGSMPIHKAIAAGHILVIKEFITQCPGTLCDIDQKGRTTLHIATKYRKAEILCYLLEQTDVKKILNTRNKEGKTFQDLVNDLKKSGRR